MDDATLKRLADDLYDKAKNVRTIADPDTLAVKQHELVMDAVNFLLGVEGIATVVPPTMEIQAEKEKRSKAEQNVAALQQEKDKLAADLALQKDIIAKLDSDRKSRIAALESQIVDISAREQAQLAAEAARLKALQAELALQKGAASVELQNTIDAMRADLQRQRDECAKNIDNLKRKIQELEANPKIVSVLVPAVAPAPANIDIANLQSKLVNVRRERAQLATEVARIQGQYDKLARQKYAAKDEDKAGIEMIQADLELTKNGYVEKIEDLDREIEELEAKLKPYATIPVPASVPEPEVLKALYEPTPAFFKDFNLAKVKKVEESFRDFLQISSDPAQEVLKTQKLAIHLEILIDWFLQDIVRTYKSDAKDSDIRLQNEAQALSLVLTEAELIMKSPNALQLFTNYYGLTALPYPTVSPGLRELFVKGIAFLFVKYATGLEFVTKDTVDYVADPDIPEAKSFFDSTLSAKVTNARNKLPSTILTLKSGPLMNLRAATKFNQIFKILGGQIDTDLTLYNMYPDNVSKTNEILSLDGLDGDAVHFRLPYTVILKDFAASAADQLELIYYSNSNKQKNVFIGTQLLFFTLLNINNAKPESETTIFKVLGKRPSYKTEGGAGRKKVEFLQTLAHPDSDYLEHVYQDHLTSAPSISAAIASGNVVAISAAIGRAVRDEKDTEIASGLVVAAKTGMTDIIPVFSGASHLLLEDDWQQAMDAANSEEMHDLICMSAGVFSKAKLSDFLKEKRKVLNANGFVAKKILEAVDAGAYTIDDKPLTLLLPGDVAIGSIAPEAFLLLGHVKKHAIKGPANLVSIGGGAVSITIEVKQIFGTGSRRLDYNGESVVFDGSAIKLIKSKDNFTVYQLKDGKELQAAGPGLMERLKGKFSKEEEEQQLASPIIIDSVVSTPAPVVSATTPVISDTIMSVTAAAMADIAAAKTDDDAWFAVTRVHDWLTERQLASDGAQPLVKLIAGDEWKRATMQIRGALEAQQYSTPDSTAWQQYESLENRYI